LTGVPGQARPEVLAVITYVTVPDEFVVLNSVCTGMVLVPEAVKPVTVPDVLEAVHAKVAPVTLDVRVTSAVGLPEQIVCERGVFVTDGEGLTVTT
jgi:hypothetical protein